jgi:protein ImuB
MTLAEARAMCPGLMSVDHDPVADERAIAALGRWMTRFTPVVATGWADDEPASSDHPPRFLLLDITGCDRLFGGVDVLEQKVTAALQRMRVAASVAVAETPGAAWAFAMSEQRETFPTKAGPCASHKAGPCRPESRATGAGVPTHGPARPGSVAGADSERQLAALPVWSLRLDESTVGNLVKLGLCTVGHLLALPRGTFEARFGRQLAVRLDQLLGNVAEPLVPLAYDVPVEARMEFESAIDSIEALWLVLAELVRRITADLQRRGHGARVLELLFTPDKFTRQPTVRRAVQLSTPTRNVDVINRLLKSATERLSCGDGFVAARLSVPVHERVSMEQIPLLDDAAFTGGYELDRLVERLRVRLGDAAVVRPELVESHLPEEAWRGVSGDRKIKTTDPPPVGPRPLQLLPAPAEIRVIAEPDDDRESRPRQLTHAGRVHRLTHSIGPERIAGQWWRGRHKTRDYYDVQDDTGRRFWIFRVVHQVDDDHVTTRWFMHGEFD